jgi:type IV pilus assembly protein PilB
MSRLGELLVRERMISLQQLQEAKSEAQRTGRRLGVALSRLGFVDDQDLTQFLARQYSLPSINLSDFEIDTGVLKLVPKEVAMKHMVVPVNRAGATLIVAMSDPSNIFAIDELKFLTQYNIEPVVAAESAIDEAIRRYYDRGPDLGQMLDEFGSGG